MKWFFVFMVLIGDFLIVSKNRIGFLIWILVDGYFSFVNLIDCDYVQATVFGLYVIMGVYGFYVWKKGDSK